MVELNWEDFCFFFIMPPLLDISTELGIYSSVRVAHTLSGSALT